MQLNVPDPQTQSYFRQDTEPAIIVDAEQSLRTAFDLNVRQGYELLFRRYYTVLCSHAVRFVYSRETAQDIVSDVFLNFWKIQAHQHITTSYRAYLFRAVRNRSYNYLQEEFRRDTLLGKPAEPTDEDMPNYDDPQRQMQLTELYQRIDLQVKLLPPQCQRVFLLSRFEGRKQREIAEELQISPKTVEAHISYALSYLRKALLSILSFILFSSL